VRSPLGRAYDRTSFLVERREFMQGWANYLDTIKAKAASEVGGCMMLKFSSCNPRPIADKNEIPWDV
jgi:hypothetical protein